MKNYNLLTFLLLVVFTFGQNPNRIYQNHYLEGNQLTLEVNDGTYFIQFYDDEIVETSFVPEDESYNPTSHAVVMKPEDEEIKTKDEENVIWFNSEDMQVKIQKSPFQIQYFHNEKEIISEKRGYFKSSHQPLEMVAGNIIADETEKIEFNLTTDEILYGAGARALGMNRRGYRLPLFNRAHYGYETHSELMNYTMPVVVSSKQYLIHFDNAPIGYLDFDSKDNNTLTYETVSGRKTYQIVVGDDWEDMIENYTQLTGRQPMLPRWTLGNFASRFGYHTQAETVETIQKFRNEKIPVDAVILDLYWFGKDVFGTMGNLKFDKDSFPNPHKMIQDLRKLDTETILITEPFVLSTSNRWEEAVQEDILAKNAEAKPYTYDFYFGNTGIIDIYSKNGYNWFKDIYKDLLNMNVTGMWGDLGEPEVHPHDIIHATGTGAELHNIYGHDWARLVQDAYHTAKPDLRPFILMRAAYSGSQRYGIVPWTGDVMRSWGGLQSQPAISLQMGMQGLGYMHSDLGGFAEINRDDELYVRWLQYGVFQPIYRPHAQEDVPSEPIFRSEKAKKLAKKAIELRYQMLPYNYNLVFENAQEGTPLMRPLFFEETDNQDLMIYADAYLWGNDFLIAPVLEQGQTTQMVYFPKNADWIDFYTGKKHEGGTTVSFDLVEEYIPTFVRAGAMIPMAKPMQSTKEYDGNTLELHYYLDENTDETELELYNDNGSLRDAYEKQAYEILEIEAEQEGRWIEFELDAETGKNYATSIKKIDLFIHHLNNTPQKVIIGKNSHRIPWRKNAKTLKLEFLWNTAYEKEIRLKLK